MTKFLGKIKALFIKPTELEILAQKKLSQAELEELKSTITEIELRDR